MNQELSICWMTSRKDAMWPEFCDSLHRECGGMYDGLRVMAIDYWANPHVTAASDNERAALLTQMHEDRRSYILNGLRCPADIFQWAAPKPSPWQGPFRQTNEDWFAAANARNTALALCKTDWIAYVDDLSCLQPGWFAEAVNSMRLERTITCGAYRKVREMVVVNGELVGWKPNLVDDGKGGQIDAGIDNRAKHAKDGVATPCTGNWMFGCSLIAPVEAFLEVNGWDERCDGMGSEDYCTGLSLAKKGWKFRYAPRMMTYESEERHHIESSFKRSDYGVSPNDKSHEMLKIAQTGNGWNPNDFGGQDLRKLRMRVCEGQAFPIPARNQREWYMKELLSSLK